MRKAVELVFGKLVAQNVDNIVHLPKRIRCDAAEDFVVARVNVGLACGHSGVHKAGSGKGLGVVQTAHVHVGFEVLVPVGGAVAFKVRADLVPVGVGHHDFDVGASKHAPCGQFSTVFLGEREAKRSVLVARNRRGSQGNAQFLEHEQGAVAVHAQERRSRTTLAAAAQRTFHHQFRSQESQLAGKLQLFVVSVPHLQVKYTCNGVAVLRRPGAREEVGVVQKLVVQNGHGTATGSGNGEVVGVGDVDSFHAVQNACRRISAHHQIVALVVGTLNSGEVRGHSRRFAAAARV